MKRAIALLFLASACAPEDVVIATRTDEGDLDGGSGSDAASVFDASDGDAGAPGDDASAFCTRQTDCPLGERCERADCVSQRGVCTVPPGECERALAPVCGCDGLTYMNDCLRRQSGVPAAHDGACDDDAVRCGGRMNVTCPRASFCGRIVLGSECRDEAVGTCWVLPDCDPAPQGRERFVACEPGRDGPCVDACAALRSGRPHTRTPRCEP